ncbi:unnamed protein product [Dibothriocephalus latus]|uniref:Uncharacterized protein n=1 Tax=Dibothriocephalus latus TaxID=60516 RepID=A0A3P7KXM6_DIBLA|nr:unnamed protein product [Dibothriocephalus latus]
MRGQEDKSSTRESRTRNRLTHPSRSAEVNKSTKENCWQKGGFKTPDVVAGPDVGAADVLHPSPGIDEEEFLKWADIDADVGVTDETSKKDFEQNLVSEIIQKEEVKNGGEANDDDDEDKEPSAVCLSTQGFEACVSRFLHPVLRGLGAPPAASALRAIVKRTICAH